MEEVIPSLPLLPAAENLSLMPIHRKTNVMVPRGVHGGIGAVFLIGIFRACGGNIRINAPI